MSEGCQTEEVGTVKVKTAQLVIGSSRSLPVVGSSKS
jgi:hypothetical protein